MKLRVGDMFMVKPHFMLGPMPKGYYIGKVFKVYQFDSKAVSIAYRRTSYNVYLTELENSFIKIESTKESKHLIRLLFK